VAAPLARRSFLGLVAGGAGVVAASVVLGACGGSGGMALVALPNDWEFLSGRPYRLGVLLADNNRQGALVKMDSPVSLRVGAPGGRLGPPIPLQIHAAGPEPTYAQTTYAFPKPGDYTLEVQFKGRRATSPIQVIEPSQSPTPTVGAKLLSTPTPTATKTLGVNPYCTQQPPCPFHAISLDDALRQRRPIALQFATPALCQSKYCGPVLENLQTAAKGRAGVTFIHCEIYNNLQGATDGPGGNLTPPVIAYNLQHEPQLYLAGAGGTIVDRIDNLYDVGEARSALTRAFGPAA
jgi:hypothetical protein